MTFGISEISNNDISGRCCPINFLFDSRVGFRGSDPFPVGKIQEAAGHHVGKFQMNISLDSRMVYLIHFHELESSFGWRNTGDNNVLGIIRLVTILNISCIHFRHTSEPSSRSSRSLHYCQQIANHIVQNKIGVPRRQSHRRSGLATLPSVGAVP